MVAVGKFNTLKVVKEVEFGLYLDGGPMGEILLPNKFVPEDAQIGDNLEVFIYFDSEDKVIATTQRPRAKMGACAFLKVIDVNRVGAFLDWGLDKDLLVPAPLQRRPMEVGKSYIVYVKQDETGRIVASSKFDRFLDKTPPEYQWGEEVSLLVAEETSLGNKVIINDSHWGLVHTSDIFTALRYGKRITGYIKRVRSDGLIDVSLLKTGKDKINELAAQVMAELRVCNGFVALHDKSTAEAIAQRFGESKKSFKSAIGYLYKQGLIVLEEDGIRLKGKLKDKS